MKTFGYSLVEESPCLTAGSETPINYTRTLFYLEAMRVQPSALVSRRFSSSREANQDYVQLPSQSIPTTEQVSNAGFWWVRKLLVVISCTVCECRVH